MPTQKKLRSKLFELLSTFSKQEMKKFGEFLNSPYHNKSKKLVKTYSFLKKFHPEYCNDRLTLQNIHNNFNTNEKFHAPTIRVDLSHLYKLGLKYLAVNCYVSFEENLYDNILNELNKRRLLNLFNKSLKFIQPVVNGRVGFSSNLLFVNYNLNANLINNVIANNDYKVIDSKKSLDTYIKLYDNQFTILIAWFLTQITEIYFNIKLISLDNEFSIEKIKITNFLHSNDFLNYRKMIKKLENNNPFVHLMLKAFDAYNNFEENKKYYVYKAEFKKYFHFLQHHEQSMHLILLNEYCIRKRVSNVNRKKFVQESLKLYDLILENNMFKTSGEKFLRPMTFRDILHTSINLKDESWVNKLIYEHINKLKKKDRIPMQNLGLMFLFFKNKDYHKALEIANSLSTEPPMNKSDIYNTRIKIYYELRNYDSALDLIRTYQNSLNKRHLFSSRSNDRLKNFLSLVRIFIQIRLGKKSINEKLLSKLDKKTLEIDNIWLSQKLDELIKEKGIK